MKNLITIISILFLSSCSKTFLERNSLVQIGAASFWKSEQDAILGVNGVYDVLQDRILYSGNLNAVAGLPMYDCFGDNLYNNYKWEGPGNFMIANIDQSFSMFSDLWRSLYKGIGRANVAIENIEKMTVAVIPDANKKTLLGQVLFLRSLFYMNLALYYGDVPLILKVQTLDEAYVSKNTYQEVAAQIIKDLKASIDMLPATYPATQFGYATKGAALGLLARFQLYNKDYQGVLDVTASILPLGYTLNSNYAQLFTEQGELSKEILFSVRFNQDVSSNGETFSATFAGAPKIDQNPMPNLVREYYCTDGKPITTSPLYNATLPKNNRDPRLSATIYFRNDTFNTSPITRFNANTPTTFGLKKYVRTGPSSTGIGIFNPGGQDFILIRYADVLLMRAEALVELNQLPEVYTILNQVRARVALPTVQAVEGSSLTQAALRDLVRHERRVELACEGLRYFDLKRWGTMQAATLTAAADNVAGYQPVYMPGGKAEVFPIPLSDLNANANLVQNPLWK
jgi:starch-binding outer membrane protein, SusD/RagB family